MGAQETLLDALCRVSGTQGGTLWQYLDGPVHNIETMKREHADLVRCGITFDSRAALVKLAKKHRVKLTAPAAGGR